jgi:hypothetical protein
LKYDIFHTKPYEDYTELSIVFEIIPEGQGWHDQDIESRLNNAHCDVVIRDIIATIPTTTTELTIFADFFSELSVIKLAFSSLGWQIEDLGFNETSAVLLYTAILDGSNPPIVIDGTTYSSLRSMHDRLLQLVDEASATLDAYIDERTYEDLMAWEGYWDSVYWASVGVSALSNTIKKGSVPSIVTALRNKQKQPLITRPPNALIKLLGYS